MGDERAATSLQMFQAQLAENPNAKLSVMGHSYGATVVAQATRGHGLHADAVVLAASGIGSFVVWCGVRFGEPLLYWNAHRAIWPFTPPADLAFTALRTFSKMRGAPHMNDGWVMPSPSTILSRRPSTTDAKESTAKFNMHSLRSQIELYRIHHGDYPDLTTNSLPQMLDKTDAAGNISATGAFGPYLDAIPPNPYDNSDMVYTAASDSPTTTTTEAKGWQYHKESGGIWPNNPEFWD